MDGDVTVDEREYKRISEGVDRFASKKGGDLGRCPIISQIYESILVLLEKTKIYTGFNLPLLVK